MDIRVTLQRALEEHSATLPGAVAIVVDRDGVLFEGATGVLEVGRSEALPLDAIFRIYSMTKALTSVAAMQLIERGELSLTTPLGEVIERLASPRVLTGFDVAGVPQYRRSDGTITMHHLLNHTAGYAYDFISEPITREHAFRQPSIVPDRWEAMADEPLLFDPGTDWHYGMSTDVLGKVVEAVSGQRLDRYFAEHVSGPLRMFDTTAVLTAPQRSRLAAMHLRGVDGSLGPYDAPVADEPGFSIGGGGLLGTGPDYARFLRMLLNGGELEGTRILEPGTFDLMVRGQLGALEPRRHASVNHVLCRTLDILPAVTQTWGYGFLINEEPTSAGRTPGSLAWGGLANTYFWVDRDVGIAGVVLCQLFPFADPAALALSEAIERAAHDAVG